MDITWLGYSCFRIKGSQAVVITDPYPPDLGCSMGKQTARIITVSHPHSYHANIDGIGGDPAPKVITGPGEYEISGILVLGISTFHDAEGGVNLGKNTVYVMEVDGVSVCHLGDLGHTLTSHQVEEIGNVDVLLVPVGGGTTIAAPDASAVVRQLDPKIVVPMHYKTERLTREADTVDKFLKEMGKEQLAPQPRLNVTRANLPETTQIVLLSLPA